MVTLFCHLGLGDLILLSGLIVLLGKRYRGLRIFCYSHHYPSVASFFAFQPEIVIIPLNNPAGDYGVPHETILEKHVDGPVIRTGFYAPGGIVRHDCSFPELFYAQAGISFGERWKSCPIERAAAGFVNNLECDIFVHDDAQRGFVIRAGIEGRTVYRPAETGESILNQVPVLRRAREIRCIDSSFYNLVESLDNITAKLFLYRSARPYIPGWFDQPKKYQWQIR